MARRAASGPDLSAYEAKRDFSKTAEPRGRGRVPSGHRFVVQKHDARRLHFDFRLELDGVLKSWAVTRGPSLDPKDKRLAVRVEDHPIEYGDFEGTIPEGSYGGGTVMLWDTGRWEPIGDPRKGLDQGKLSFRLEGERLRGEWALVRMRGGRDRGDGKRENWLLVKADDAAADPGRDLLEEETTSVKSGRSLAAIAAGDTEWVEGAAQRKKAPQRSRRRPAALPDFVEPALASLVDDVPAGDDWVFEVKFDGYRALLAADGQQVRLNTRNGLDWTDRFPGLAKAVAALDLDRVLLDGEIIVADDTGRSDFGALQDAIGRADDSIVLFAFDLLAEKGRSLLDQPLVKRKARLKEILGTGHKGHVFYSDHVEGGGRVMLDTLCRKGFEGVVAKRAQAPYRSGRGGDWLKIKCETRQEFIIAGTSRSDKNRPFASLILGVMDEGRLRYAGRVGSGFSDRALDELERRFRAVERPTPPFDEKLPASVVRGARWVEPTLVAEVAFAGFTRDNLVRQGRFVGLREDKPAEDIVREEARTVTEVQRQEARRAKRAKASKSGGDRRVRLTHPEKLLYPDDGISKEDLAQYFELVGESMRPFIERRLVSFVRCPAGQTGHCFFQRHLSQGMAASFRGFEVEEKEGDVEEYIYLEGRDSLVEAAQIGVLELHIWGSRIDDIERADRLVFDLDPAEDVPFERVRDGAMRVRDALQAIGLESLPLLTGGKGVHVVAPIRAEHDWPTIKALARALAEHFTEHEPEHYVATMTKAKRGGKIFIDHFRNERGSTAIAPFSPRARPGAPVAWPISWETLRKVKGANAVTIATAGRHDRDAWADYDGLRRPIPEAALAALLKAR
jgi:bifunctional non-homologous end joining protein LigD